MEQLCNDIRAHFTEPLIDGRTIRLRLEEHGAERRLVVTASSYRGSDLLATLSPSAAGYLVEVPTCLPTECGSREEVLELIEYLARPYSNICWSCHQPVTLTTESRCPKCWKYVLCACGKCLCDNPEYHIRPAISPQKVEELNRRYGHLFRSMSG